MLASKPHNVAFAWFGVIAVVVFSICWICAAAIDTTWVFGENTLSDLGASDSDAKMYFNYGCCMVTAICLAIFGFATTTYSKSRSASAAGIILIIAAVFLFLIGLFTKDVGTGDLHKTLACLMGFFMFLAVCLYAGAFWNNGHEAFAAVPVIVILALIVIFTTQNLATFEAWSAVGAIPFMVVATTDLILTKPKAKI